MAAPDITTPSPSIEQIASGATYSRTLSANNTPTSWSLSGAPPGIVINNSGVMTGAPTATGPASYTITATATNGDGSDTLTWLIIVMPSVIGLDGGGFTIPIDFDLSTRRLSIPGVGSPQPAARPPVASGTTEPLATWINGERFDLSLGILASGVLQELDLNRVKVLWRELGDATTVELHEDADSVTETGAGSTARYTVPIYLDPDDLTNTLTNYEADDGARVNGYLQIVAESSTDASDFSYFSSQSITTLSASDTEAKTFAVTLSSTSATALAYTVTETLVCPSESGLNRTVVRNITVSYNSGGSTYVLATNTGDANDTGEPLSDSYSFWSTTLTPTSITATSTGLSIVATATTSANAYDGVSIDVDATYGANAGVFEIVDNVVTGITGTQTLDFLDTGVSIGTVNVTNGMTTATLKAAIEAAISETLVAVLFPSSTLIRIVFDSGTAVEDYHFGGEINLGGPSSYPGTLTYSNAYITCSVVGVEMPELSQTIKSQITPLAIEMTFDT